MDTFQIINPGDKVRFKIIIDGEYKGISQELFVKEVDMDLVVVILYGQRKPIFITIPRKDIVHVSSCGHW